MRSPSDAALRVIRDAAVTHHDDPASRRSAERDFGGIAHGSCLTVLEPSNVEACARLVLGLAREELGVTVRGTGDGQSGQSVAADTLTLSTRRLDQIGRVDSAFGTITVGAGATLRRTLLALDGSGLL